jgi:ubiquinone/menaquinone biosynthesis C-methylase UbiE
MVSRDPLAGRHEAIKQCCARFYEHDLVRLLAGDSLHPGGLTLTERLGVLLELTPRSRVLDVAAGTGTSAAFVAERFGCEVIGIDYGADNVEVATAAAAAKGLAARLRFERGDAEQLPADSGAFDAVVCECAFCTFPDKAAAAGEFARVLRPGGRVGLSDLTRGGVLPKEFDGLLAWVACVADALTPAQYSEYLHGAGIQVFHSEAHDNVLIEAVHQVRLRLLSLELLTGLRKQELPDIDVSAVKHVAQAVLEAIQQRKLGYVILCGTKS